MPSRGVIYLVSGGRSYLGELLTSLRSLRRYEPTLPVTVFSRFALPAGTPCSWVPFRSDHHPLKEKVMVLPLSPYEETLFLDTDTTILGPVQPIFDYLNELDFVVGNMFLGDWSVKPTKLLALVKPDDYNTGVLVFRRTPETGAFLDKWKEAVLPQNPKDMWAGHNCDQDYFNKIVREGAPQDCGLRFGTFPNVIYNVRGTMTPELKNQGLWPEVRIYHHRTRRMKVNKMLFSFTDPDTAREVAIKLWGRLKRPKVEGAPSPPKP
jgi:hypothetical protein